MCHSQFWWLSYLGLFKVIFESDVCISGFSEVFQYPVLSQSSCLTGLMTCFWDLAFVESALRAPFLWEDPWSVLCVSTFLGRLSRAPLALLPALTWNLLADSKNLKFLEPPTHNWDRISVDMQALTEQGERQAMWSRAKYNSERLIKDHMKGKHSSSVH